MAKRRGSVVPLGAVGGGGGTAEGALETLLDVDLATVVAGDCSWGTLDLKAEGDGAIGTVTIGGVALPIVLGSSSGASAIVFDGIGLKMTKTANNTTQPDVYIRLTELLAADLIGRLVIEAEIAWTDFPAELNSHHAVLVDLVRNSTDVPSTGTRILGFAHRQNDGSRNSRYHVGSSIYHQITESFFGTRVITLDCHSNGNTVGIDTAGASWPTAYTKIAKGNDAQTARAWADAAGLDWADHVWLHIETFGETGTYPNEAYDLTLRKLRIRYQVDL